MSTIDMCTKILLQIMAAWIPPDYWWILQIALIFITKYDSFQNYYKLRQKWLQITAGITNCGVITNCVVAIETLLLSMNIMIIDLPWCDASLDLV